MDDVVSVEAGAPALFRLLDMAAERFGHHLVAKADADHLRLSGIADELLERFDPWEGLVDARRRAGDQVSGVPVRAVRQLPSSDVERLDFKLRPKQLREHGGIVAELLRQFAGRP